MDISQTYTILLLMSEDFGCLVWKTMGQKKNRHANENEVNTKVGVVGGVVVALASVWSEHWR